MNRLLIVITGKSHYSDFVGARSYPEVKYRLTTANTCSALSAPLK